MLISTFVLCSYYAPLPYLWGCLPRDLTDRLMPILSLTVNLLPTDIHGLWSVLVVNLKFIAISISEIVGQSLDTPMLPFLQNFNGLLFGWTL